MLDVHEWLADRLDRLPEPARRLGPVIVQDPCHLRHVQRAHEPVRTVLARVADVVELDDDGLCCGAGGAYSALQPELATAVRERKVAAIARAAARSGATVVRQRQPRLRDAPRGRRPRRAPPRRPRRRRRLARVKRAGTRSLAERSRRSAASSTSCRFDLLQQAVADGATQRPPEDRALTQARRAVEKAAGLLRQLAS